jgi:Ca2+-binding RTX toxin-like protein
MRRARVAAASSVILLAGLAGPPASQADHVTASPTASARGERVSTSSWRVIVDWSINCNVSGGSYFGNLNLVDAATGETTYLGGTASASGTARQNVARRATARFLFPRIRSSCSSAPPQSHGSGFRETDGGAVRIPPIGEGDAPSRRSDGGQGRRDFPRSGFGGPRDPLRRGGCDRQTVGTSGDDRLTGDGRADLIFGLPGADRLSGRGDDDCLVGGSGRDRLTGGTGWDRLTGGRGNDVLAGNSGRNRYDAGSGNDVVRAANGRAELVSCGTGRDRASADRSDRVRGCERIRRVR